VDSFYLPTNGQAGSGLDLDGNPDTCAPPGNCSGGIDNALGVLGTDLGDFSLNDSFIEALEGGQLVYMVSMVGFNLESVPFTLRVYIGEPVLDVDECDVQDSNQTCDYVVYQDSFAPDCAVLVEFTNAVVDESGQLSAGGTGGLFIVNTKFSGSFPIAFAIFDATIQASLTLGVDAAGNTVLNATQGIIAGAVPKQTLKDTLNNVSDSIIPATLKILINGVLDNGVVDDLDVDQDGVPDAASIGIRFTTIFGNIVLSGD